MEIRCVGVELAWHKQNIHSNIKVFHFDVSLQNLNWSKMLWTTAMTSLTMWSSWTGVRLTRRGLVCTAEHISRLLYAPQDETCSFSSAPTSHTHCPWVLHLLSKYQTTFQGTLFKLCRWVTIHRKAAIHGHSVSKIQTGVPVATGLVVHWSQIRDCNGCQPPPPPDYRLYECTSVHGFLVCFAHNSCESMPYLRHYYEKINISGGSRISRRGGVDLVGGVDSRGGYVLKILYVKTKESGPLGGHAPGTPPLDPPMNMIMAPHWTIQDKKSVSL